MIKRINLSNKIRNSKIMEQKKLITKIVIMIAMIIILLITKNKKNRKTQNKENNYIIGLP